nr:transcription termination/antitermination protein NusA-like [Tanacetum cinerariifolium]
AAPAFLERLFEQEVPEIFDGLITIKNVVREPGERAKVAVESYDERIDPVGACVEEETVDDVYRVIRQEFADDDDLPTDEAAPAAAPDPDSAPAAQ